MWIKNLNVFQAEDKLPWTAAEIEAALNAARCPACGSQSLSTEGFAPPLKHAEAMVYSVDGLVFALHQEISRLLPAAVINEELAARAEALAAERGHEPGRRERSELKDQIIFELLPRAFTRSRYTGVLIDLQEQRIWVDNASDTRAEQVISALREALGSVPVTPVNGAADTADVLTRWVQAPDTLPAQLTLGDRCELQDMENVQASVRCTAVDLGSEEVQAHLEAGMQVTKLNLCWDDALEFDVTERLALKRIRPLDRINDSLETLDNDDAVAELQARLALQGGALRQVLRSLYPALGVATDASAAAA